MYFSMFMVVTIVGGIEATKDFLLGSKEILRSLKEILYNLGWSLRTFLADPNGLSVIQNTIVGTTIPVIVDMFSFPQFLS